MSDKTPGKHCRKGISLRGTFKMLPDSDTAEAWFAEQRWNGKSACPECASENVQSDYKHKTMPYRCREKHHGKKFSVKTGMGDRILIIRYGQWSST